MKLIFITLVIAFCAPIAFGQTSTLNVQLRTQAVDGSRNADVAVRIIVSPSTGSTVTQAELDQALFQAFAPFVTQITGEAALCLKNPDGSCQKDGQGRVIYDSAIITPLIRRAFKRELNKDLIEAITADEQAKAAAAIESRTSAVKN